MSEKEEKRREIGLWRGVAAAWAMALLVFVAFAGVQAAATLRSASTEAGNFAGAVIPHHNERCPDGQCRDGSSPFAHWGGGDYTVQ
jgi:hypothetical protein